MASAWQPELPLGISENATVDEQALLLQVSEVRRLLNRSRARIYEMCATGELESIRDGRSILIPRDALHQWISKKRRQGRR